MSKRFIKRFGAVCTGAVISLGSLCFSGTSAPVSVSAAGSDNYAKLLQYSLYFYDTNMCGKNVESKGGVSWRQNCHTSDEVPGGFHDAGDHAMFGLPQGYTAAALGLSYYEFKDAYQATGQEDHIKMILNEFCTFFRNSTKLSGDSVSNFLYQKGDGSEDHAYWGTPENQGGSRKMYWTSNGASDIAANYASALALNYKNFGNEEDLKYAKALYKFSTQYNQCATYGPSPFYDSSKCKDEQTMAAGCLALATGDNSYKEALKNGVGEIGVWWAYGWNDANLGAAVMNGIVNKDWSAANSYLSSKCSGSNYLFMDKWGSARLNCSMQFMALVATKEGAADYTNWSVGQMNYILGSNPANTCFVTGFASNSAKYPHHRAASGYNGYGEFNSKEFNPDGDHMDPYNTYGANGKTIIGALVGGPCKENGDYHDNMSDYVCNEVAIDYNAGLVGAAAGLYHFKKTGSVDSTIQGITKIYSGSTSIETTPTANSGDTTTTTTVTTTTGGHSSETGSLTFSKASDIDNNPKWVVNPSGASKLTFNFKTNSNDTQANGCFEINGKMTEWKASPSGGTMTVECEVPAGASEVYVTVWWPTSSTLESVTGTGISNVTTTTTTMTTTTTTTTTTTNTTTTTTATTTTTTTTSSEDINRYEYRRGDVDCNKEVNIMDAVLLARLVGDNAGNDVTEEGKANANTNNDGVVDSNDLNKLMRYLGKYYTWAQFNA